MSNTTGGFFQDPDMVPALDEKDTPAIQYDGQNWYHDKQSDRFFLYGRDKTQIAMLQRNPEGFRLSIREYDETEWIEQPGHQSWDEALEDAAKHEEKYHQEFEQAEYRERRLQQIEGRDINQEGENDKEVPRSGLLKNRSPNV